MAQEPEVLQELEYHMAGGIYTAKLNARHAEQLNAVPVGTLESGLAAGAELEAAPVAKTKKRETVPNKSMSTE